MNNDYLFVLNLTETNGFSVIVFFFFTIDQFLLVCNGSISCGCNDIILISHETNGRILRLIQLAMARLISFHPPKRDMCQNYKFTLHTAFELNG